MLELVGENDGRQENTEVGAAREHGQSVKVEGMGGFGEAEISPARHMCFASAAFVTSAANKNMGTYGISCL